MTGAPWDGIVGGAAGVVRLVVRVLAGAVGG